MANGETFKASVIGELADGTGVVFDFGYVDNNPSSVHLDTGTMAGDFQTLVQAIMATSLPDDYTFKRYRVACVSGAHAGEIGYVEVSPPVLGQASAVNRMANELCVSIKRATGHASRRDRGRIFFGPIPLGAMDNANVNKIVPTFYSDVAELLKANLTTSATVLKPVILNSAGAYSGNLVNRVGIADVIVHRKSRRPRQGA